jgi:hypothetical protein
MKNKILELDFFYLITRFLISPKGEKFPRIQTLTYGNPTLTPSPLGEVPIAIGRDGGLNQ